MSDILISNITVEYPIYDADNRSLKKSLINTATGGKFTKKGELPIVTALQNFSAHIQHGDRIGLTGHNGSGKSTLLRVIAGILKPSKGKVTVNGSVSTLFDIGLGMDDHLTGYENIMIRGLLLGMTKKQILEKIDEIVEFTELGNFLSVPIHTYSDGMRLRLAFSVSTAFQPDILLMDEGILAGDAAFIEKAEKRLDEFVDNSSILILATHSRDLLDRFCHKEIALTKGRKI
jgi:ABC-type polysaccharide/polyol phosphate transport system ATPase subunit